MKVTDLNIQKTNDECEISALVDGYRLWYRLPVTALSPRSGDVLLTACLLPAMAKGESLEIDESAGVCPILLRNTERLQDIFAAWAPALRIPFRRVPIHARTENCSGPKTENGSFFSGGVDGTCTFLRNRFAISHLVFVKGIDMQLTNDSLYSEVIARNGEFAEQMGKPLVPVVTNARFFGHAHGVPWPTYFGAGLASVAHLLGFGKMFVASGVHYSDLVPHGSHPLTDPLWSSQSTAIVHDGADTRRIDKLKTVANCQPALNVLRVCWQDKQYNCGRCEKCLRTMIQLRLLGIDAPTFPKLTDLSAIRSLDLWDETERDFLAESLRYARQGSDQELLSALAACARRNEIRALRHRCDDLLFSGRIHKWFHSLRKRIPKNGAEKKTAEGAR